MTKTRKIGGNGNKENYFNFRGNLMLYSERATIRNFNNFRSLRQSREYMTRRKKGNVSIKRRN